MGADISRMKNRVHVLVEKKNRSIPFSKTPPAWVGRFTLLQMLGPFGGRYISKQESGALCG